MRHNYPTLSEIKNRFQNHENIIADENLISEIKIKNEDILIEFKNEIIGELENDKLNTIIKLIKTEKISVRNIFIILPENLLFFVSAFVSSLYIMKQIIGCEPVLYGNDKNNRVFELIHLMFSGLLAPENDKFFSIVTYNSEVPHKEWKKETNTFADEENKYVVSSKNLPLIPINEINNKSLFETKLVSYLENTKLKDGNLKEKKASFYSSFKQISSRYRTINFYNLHFYNFLNKLIITTTDKEYKASGFDYSYIFINYLKKALEELPIINVLIFNLILEEDFLKKQLVTFYNRKKGRSLSIHSKVVYLEFVNNIELQEEFINDFFKPNLIFVQNITKGLYELTKNVVEHSSNKRGVLTFRLSNWDEIRRLKNKEKITWNNYLNNLSDSILDKSETFVENEKEKLFLDISLVDDGEKGIIEKSYEELEKASNENTDTNPLKRLIPKDVASKDLAGIKSNLSNQSKLLYEMYFNPNPHTFILSRQTNWSAASFGLYIFTKFIHSSKGIFNVNSLSYDQNPNNEKGTISFYCSHESENFIETSVSSAIGTSYNIIIPFIYSIIKNDIRKDKNEKEKLDTALPTSLFQRMLSFDPKWKEDTNNLKIRNIYIKKIKNIVNIFDGSELISVIDIFPQNYSSDGENEFIQSKGEIDRSDLLRILAEYITLHNKKAIIVTGLSSSVLADFLQLILQWSEIKNSLLREHEAIFFYVVEDQGKGQTNNRNKEKIFVLAGVNKQECIDINSIINSNPFLPNVFNFPGIELNENKENNHDFPEHLQTNENIINNQLFVGKDLIIRFDILKRSQGNKLSPSEQEAKDDLERNIDNNGYKWENTHLKIGTKLHLRDFIYGKKMFQKNYEASRFAFSLAHDFYNTTKNEHEPINYTFIGYGYYSELLVSRLKEFVTFLFKSTNKECINKSEISYAIVKDEEEIKFARFFKDEERRHMKDEETQEKIVIVVPISSTLTTCLKIENAFRKDCENRKGINFEDSYFSVFEPFYTVVIVGDGTEDNVQRNLSLENNIVKDYWKEFNPHKPDEEAKKIIITENREHGGERRNHYNIYIASKWQSIENCKDCFPENPLQEMPLFGTDKVVVTPSLVFKEPQHIDIKNKKDNLYFYITPKKNGDKKDIIGEKPFIDDSMLEETHYYRDSKHFRYYLYYNEVIRENFEQIERWANKLKIETKNSEQVLLIAPDKSENGEFIHLVNRIVFQERANIIKVEPYGDHYGNFDQFYKRDIENSDKIYFIDNLLATGETLTKVAEYLNIVAKEINKEIKIEAVFALINRMDFESTNRVQSINNLNDFENNQHSFISLNVPVFSNPSKFCPICNDEQTYKELAKNASLDVLRAYYKFKELPCYAKEEKEEILRGKDKGKHNSKILKIALTHYINRALSEGSKFMDVLKEGSIKEEIKFYNFNAFREGLESYIKNKGNCNFDHNNTLKLKANIIKIMIIRFIA